MNGDKLAQSKFFGVIDLNLINDLQFLSKLLTVYKFYRDLDYLILL